MESLTVAIYMLSYVRQRVAYRPIGIQSLVMLIRVPVSERWKLLGDGREQANNNADRRRFHVLAKLIDNLSVLNTIS